MESRDTNRYIPWDEISWPEFDVSRLTTTESEAWWEWPGMFWRWSTGPMRRLVARVRRAG